MTPIVAVYARVSTRQQEQETTIESQLAQLLSYAQQQGYRIDPTHQYLDQAVSGTQLNRRGLNQLRDAAAAHEIDLLLCATPDRLARTLGLQLVLLEEFRGAGVTVVFLDHPQLGTDPQSQLLLQVQGVFAEYERDLIRARLQRGKLYRLRQGQVPARAPYGYLYQPRTTESAPAWEVLPATAAVVQQIFTWYAEEGWPLRQIQMQLNAQSTPAPQGEGWQHSSLHYILTQSAYRGTVYVNRSTQPPETIGEPRQRGHGRRRAPRRVARPPEEWIAIPVPAIVSPQLWTLAQERLQMNAQFATRNTRRTYLLRGLLECGVCGHILQARTVQGQATYYVCRYGGKYRDPDKPVHTCSVRADFIEPLVWKALTDLLHDPNRMREAWEALHAETQPQSGEVRAWQQRRAQLQQQAQRLLDAYQCGVLSLDELGQRRERLQRELRGLETRLAQVTADPPAQLALDIFTQRISRALQAPDPETQQEVIRLLIERVVISDNEITIEHIIPLDDTCQLRTADC